MRTLASGQAARLSIWISRVRIPSSLPGPVRPTDQDTSLRNSKFRFESGAGYQVWARLPAARMGHCLCLDGGSIPLAPANAPLLEWCNGSHAGLRSQCLRA